jgi:MOSC domain-containing protein YiiM
VDHASLEALQRSLDAIRRSPRATGTVELIVRRPAVDEREPLEAAELDPVEGLVGDTWRQRPSSRTPDRSPHPDMQLTLMNARAAAAIAGARERWPLAGDQLYVDLDLSADAVPPGTRLAVGSALVEVTDQPHTGCGKFARRFGVDAVKFVNSREGRALNLRGVNARVVERGAVRTGDAIRVA